MDSTNTRAGGTKIDDVTVVVSDDHVLQEAVGYRLRRAHLAVFQDFNETFSSAGVRPAEFSVLFFLAGNAGLKQSDVAEQLGIQRANFVALVDGLAARGLVERRKGADRRIQALHLTAGGKRFVEQISGSWREHEERMIDKLGGAEARDQLIDLLGRLAS